VTKIDTIIEQTSGLKLLYVEDNKMARDSTLELLREFFDTILIAENGEEGLEIFKREEIDLIITDINMPKKNGLEMVEEIRKTHPDIDIVVLTAHTEYDYLKESIRLGIRGYLNKPIELDNLVDVLQMIVSEAILNAERKQHMREQEEQNRFLQSVIDSIQDPIMVIDTDYRIKVLNDFPLSKQPAQAIDGEITCYKLLHDLDQPCDPAERLCPLREIERTRKNLTVIHAYDERDTWVKYEIHASPLTDSDEHFNGIVATARDITHHISTQKKLEAQTEELGHRIRHDTLTQLANRVYFEEAFAEAKRQADIQGNLAAVLFIDLNDFKAINDTKGHQVGDRVLKAISDAMQGAVRRGDTLARIGGDEFALIATGIQSPQESVTIAQKLLDAVNRPLTIDGETIRLAASIGIAHYPQDGADIETLLSKSDSAMYRAKQSSEHIALHRP
jgi:diguanylate cyclase (GGDEF)-like protein